MKLQVSLAKSPRTRVRRSNSRCPLSPASHPAERDTVRADRRRRAAVVRLVVRTHSRDVIVDCRHSDVRTQSSRLRQIVVARRLLHSDSSHSPSRSCSYRPLAVSKVAVYPLVLKLTFPLSPASTPLNATLFELIVAVVPPS